MKAFKFKMKRNGTQRLGYIHLQDVDMVLGPMSITPQRETVVDFTYPYWEEATGMLTLTVPGDGFYFLKPLQIYVWCCFVSILIVAAWFVRSYEWNILHIKSGFSQLGVSLWYFYGTMWAQGKFERVNKSLHQYLYSNETGPGIIRIHKHLRWQLWYQCALSKFLMHHQNKNDFKCMI